MHKVLSSLLLTSSLFFAAAASAQNATKQWRTADSNLSGRWIVSTTLYGSPLYFMLKLEQNGEKLTGDLEGDKLEGSVTGNKVQFLAKDEQGGSEDTKGTVQDGTITGTIVFVNGEDPTHPTREQFTATIVPKRRAGSPQRHEFVPTTFYRRFSAENKPVLTIAPGDTVHTTTVDAGGADEKGVARVLGGNPETGPFYIETASPGDTLAVHIRKLRLNRDYAISDDGIVGRGLDSDWAAKMKDGFKNVRWHLDVANGTASPEKPAEHLTHYSVPVRPMLGCVAVAPGITQAAPGTGDSGRFGGNMDFNEIIEGSTVYLSVNVPGALLYFGDGHALQGDGELNGNALETSMDVEVTVDVIPNKRAPGPRVESQTHFMAMGLAGSLDDAFREATANMASWLTDEYKLTPSEVAQVLGTASEYKVSEVADRNAGVVLKINKDRLKGLVLVNK
jgi:amidase